MHTVKSPFLLDDNELYLRWRDKKMANYPSDINSLFVEVNNPKILSKKECSALIGLIRRTNMAIYVSNTDASANPQTLKSIAKKFGISLLNKNWLANDDGITALTVPDNGIKKNYIPYTNKAINWHTDGYYNSKNKQIHSFILHAVQKAENGGENQLMDHEIAYILLREKNIDYIRALMADDVMTIPAGIDMNGKKRPDTSGPVFSVSATGNLHMRYSARKKNIIWDKSSLVASAIDYLQKILNDKSSNYIFSALLEPGMGIINNNVLHSRCAFTDGVKNKRFYYRARYFDRVKNTDYKSLL